MHAAGLDAIVMDGKKLGFLDEISVLPGAEIPVCQCYQKVGFSVYFELAHCASQVRSDRLWGDLQAFSDLDVG